MTDPTNARKVEHLDIIAVDTEVDRRKFYFDDLRLTHRALPELDLASIDASTVLMGKRLRLPLLISSMTGGDHELLRRINHNLAKAAEAAQVAMAVGSQRVMFDTPAARDSFALRSAAPTTLLFANLGAVQLNYGFGLAQCRAAVEVVGADALCLHLNPLQEAVQPEGDTNFRGLAARIREVNEALPVPLVLKEVGAGFGAADAELALRAGIRYVDVAGTGGTSWSRIENHRSRATGNDDDLGLAFQDWGIPTPLALMQMQPFLPRLTVIGSGGIRNGLDMVKAIILGASLCGLASPFLEPAKESPAAVVAVIERLAREFTTAMFLLGVDSVANLRGRRDLLL